MSEVSDRIRKNKLLPEDMIQSFESMQATLAFWGGWEHIGESGVNPEVGFLVAGCGGGQGGYDFSIVTIDPNPLPEKVANLFMDQVNIKWHVSIEETDLYKDWGERSFYINVMLIPTVGFTQEQGLKQISSLLRWRRSLLLDTIPDCFHKSILKFFRKNNLQGNKEKDRESGIPTKDIRLWLKEVKKNGFGYPIHFKESK